MKTTGGSISLFLGINRKDSRCLSNVWWTQANNFDKSKYWFQSLMTTPHWTFWIEQQNKHNPNIAFNINYACNLSQEMQTKNVEHGRKLELTLENTFLIMACDTLQANKIIITSKKYTNHRRERDREVCIKNTHQQHTEWKWKTKN